MHVSKSSLLELIGQTAKNAAGFANLNIDPGAIRRLQTPTPQFADQDQFDVEEAELRQTVEEIISSASRVARRSDRNTITRSDIDEALRTYACHLLWLC